VRRGDPGLSEWGSWWPVTSTPKTPINYAIHLESPSGGKGGLGATVRAMKHAGQQAGQGRCASALASPLEGYVNFRGTEAHRSASNGRKSDS
jgi:hypothetical protein